MFGDLSDGPDLVIEAPEPHASHQFGPIHCHTFHYCLSCHTSRHSPAAHRECVPKVVAEAVTVQPKVIDWFKYNRDFSA